MTPWVDINANMQKEFQSPASGTCVYSTSSLTLHRHRSPPPSLPRGEWPRAQNISAMLLGRRLLGGRAPHHHQLDTALQLPGGGTCQVQCSGVLAHRLTQVPLRSLAAAAVAAGSAGGTSLPSSFRRPVPPGPVTKVHLKSLSSSSAASVPSPSPSNNQVACKLLT